MAGRHNLLDAGGKLDGQSSPPFEHRMKTRCINWSTAIDKSVKLIGNIRLEFFIERNLYNKHVEYESAKLSVILANGS